MRKKTFHPARKRNRALEASKRLASRWKTENDSDWIPEKEPRVASMLESVEGGWPKVLEALRASSEPDVSRFLETYDSLTASDLKSIPIETIAFASGIGSLRLVEVAQTALFLHGSMMTEMLISSAMPKVTRAIIRAATEETPIKSREGEVIGTSPGDVKAMEVFGRMSGIVPVPKGSQIAIQNNYRTREKEPEEIQERGWKYPEDRLKEIAAACGETETNPKSKPVEIVHFGHNRPVVFER